MADEQDRQLGAIKACQAGNAHAFGTLYDTHVRAVYEYVYFKTFHKETAEDITSQVFIKAIDRIQLFDPDKAQFKTWLFRIAHNTIVDYYRSKKEDKNLDDVVGPSGENIVEATHSRLEAEKIRRLVQTLPSPEQDILLLRLWHDLSYKEISQIVNKTESNCKMIFSRGLKKIREYAALIVLFFVSSVISL